MNQNNNYKTSMGNTEGCINNIVQEFEKLSIEIEQVLQTVKRLIIQLNFLAINTATKSDQRNDDNPDFLEMAKQLWKLAEKCTTASVQIGILCKDIIKKSEKIKIPKNN
ncbi:MAG: hypothetical protein V2B14_06150 [bacterium]